MIKKLSTLVAASMFLAPVVCLAAMPEVDMSLSNPQAQKVLFAAEQNHYKLVEKEARQALDLLKILTEYAKDVSEHATNLRNDMNEHHYNDWVNTRLLKLVGEANTLRESVHNTYGLEKDKVSEGLKAAKGGDFEPINETITRINKFREENHKTVADVEAKVRAVESDYKKDYGNAKAALEQFKKTAPVPDLLAAKPKLVKGIFLETASVRPIIWRIVLEKQNGNYNDPRFGQVPRLVSVPDAPAPYAVVVR